MISIKRVGVLSLSIVMLFASAAEGVTAASLDCLPRSSVACSTPWWADATVIVPIATNRIFADACMHHDFCYRFGWKTYAHSRLTCDNHFLSEARRACEPSGFWGRLAKYASGTLTVASCKAAAKIYYTATRKFGADAYAKNKSKFCEYESADVVMDDLRNRPRVVRDHRTK